ncbi:MAG: tetratricopeptide repeat protein [Spirochaetales bacterium]
MHKSTKFFIFFDKICLFFCIFGFFLIQGCSNHSIDIDSFTQFETTQNELFTLLEKTDPGEEQHFAIIHQIANNYQSQKQYNDLIVFLTNHVAQNPNDEYNAYWLLLTAYTYLETGAKPVAEMYFERIIKNYEDLSVKDESIHMLCLRNLLQISTDSENRVEYFLHLLRRYPNEISKAEIYARLAAEYEKLTEWELALKAYENFLEQPNAATIQVVGIPGAYTKARQFVEFNNSAKNWTFETLEELQQAVSTALAYYQFYKLEQYKSANFFAMSWKQNAAETNTVVNYLLADYAAGRRIYYSAELDESSTPNEAYLRTWNWPQYVSVWYFYFRKVNFPLDPEIHGRWEWAGIYYGEKL